MLVYPTKETALNVVHPNGHKVTEDGADWPDDSFTGRMLIQNILTTNEAVGLKERRRIMTPPGGVKLSPATAPPVGIKSSDA